MMPEMQGANKAERSIGELLGDLANETTTLLRQELTLFKAEMSQKATTVGKNVAFLAAGGAVAYAGFLAIVAALVIGLGEAGLPWWLSALLVGLVVAGAGGALVWKGLQALKQADLAPRETIETLKEDTKWVRERAT